MNYVHIGDLPFHQVYESLKEYGVTKDIIHSAQEDYGDQACIMIHGNTYGYASLKFYASCSEYTPFFPMYKTMTFDYKITDFSFTDINPADDRCAILRDDLIVVTNAGRELSGCLVKTSRGAIDVVIKSGITKIVKEHQIGRHKVTIDGDTLKVGCTTLTKEEVESIKAVWNERDKT